MKVETYRRLRAVRDQFGPRKFGTICQKLLGLGLQVAGYEHVVERGVQGVDLDVARLGGARYAIEVKTTIEPRVILGLKDFEGLNQRGADGYQAAIAVLRLNLLADWLVIDATKIRPGSYLIDRLIAMRIDGLQEEARSGFAQALCLYGPQLMQHGPGYLDRVIRGKHVRGEVQQAAIQSVSER